MDWWCWWQTTGLARLALYLELERGHVLCATINNHNTVQFLLEDISNVQDIIANKYLYVLQDSIYHASLRYFLKVSCISSAHFASVILYEVTGCVD